MSVQRRPETVRPPVNEPMLREPIFRNRLRGSIGECKYFLFVLFISYLLVSPSSNVGTSKRHFNDPGDNETVLCKIEAMFATRCEPAYPLLRFDFPRAGQVHRYSRAMFLVEWVDFRWSLRHALFDHCSRRRRDHSRVGEGSADSVPP